MEHLLHDGEEREDSKLSEDELADLIETKFVLQKLESKHKQTEDVEQPRDVGSPVAFHLSPNGHPRNEIVLDEYECLRRPVSERTSTDEASLLMNRILKASEGDLTTFALWNVFESSKKWKQTSRATELALINSVVSLVDSRPIHLHLFFRRLIEADVFELVRQALLEVAPPTKRRSLLRMVVKMDAGMPLKQLLGQINNLYDSVPNLEITEGMVTAVRIEFDGFKQKLLTPEVYKFSELEKYLMIGEPAKRIEATVRLGFAVPGRSHVSLNVEYHTELVGSTGKMIKNITIEQSVVPSPRVVSTKHVSFGSPELTAIHPFELPDFAPFNPLGLSHKFGDLIQHLERKADAPVGDLC